MSFGFSSCSEFRLTPLSMSDIYIPIDIGKGVETLTFSINDFFLVEELDPGVPESEDGGFPDSEDGGLLFPEDEGGGFLFPEVPPDFYNLAETPAPAPASESLSFIGGFGGFGELSPPCNKMCTLI